MIHSLLRGCGCLLVATAAIWLTLDIWVRLVFGR